MFSYALLSEGLQFVTEVNNIYMEHCPINLQNTIHTDDIYVVFFISEIIKKEIHVV